MDARIEVTLVIEGQPSFGSVRKTVVKNVALPGDNPGFLAANATEQVVPAVSKIVSGMIGELANTYGTLGFDETLKRVAP